MRDPTARRRSLTSAAFIIAGLNHFFQPRLCRLPSLTVRSMRLVNEPPPVCRW